MREEAQRLLCSESLSEGTSSQFFNSAVTGAHQCWWLLPQTGQPEHQEPGCGHMSLLPTYFSLSPSHFDVRSADDTEKKVELLASVATALAR